MNTTGTKTVESGGSGRDKIEVSLAAVRAGDRSAFDVLVAELSPLVWHVARSNGLDRTSAEDVVQTVWLASLRHIDRLSEPRALAGWLITTTRREAQRVRQRAADHIELSSKAAEQMPTTDPSPEHEVLRDERDRQLWSAFHKLTQRCQEMLRLTVLTGRAEYRAVAEALHMPHGSIGPTRGRCLNNLRILYQAELDAAPLVNAPLEIPEPDLEFLVDDEAPEPIPVTAWTHHFTHRTFPASIYVYENTVHEQVERAFEALLQNSRVEVVERDDPIIGSWFRRMRTRVVESDVLGEVAAVAAHAADARGVLAHDATITATLMQNLGPLLAALEPTRDAVIRVGALLIVKMDWVVAVHQLTSVQQLRLDHQPHLLTSPRDILRALDLTPESLPTSVAQPISEVSTPVPPTIKPDYVEREDQPCSTNRVNRQHQGIEYPELG